MRCDEASVGDDKSLGGDDGDARSVSTLDIADAAAAAALPLVPAAPACATPESDAVGSNPDGAQSRASYASGRRESDTKLQMEDAEQTSPCWKYVKDLQCDMKMCTIAFVVASIIFVIIILFLCFKS